MAESIFYQFDGFCLDPDKRTLSRNGELRPLRPTAFDLLLALVESHGRTVPKSDLIKRVWQSTFADDRNFHVTLHAVRQALGDSVQTPTFILREPRGYRFVAEVIVRRFAGTESQSPSRSSNHLAFVLCASAMYAALYATALPLEVAYKWDEMGRRALWLTIPVFVWVLITSILGLKFDERLTVNHRKGGLRAAVATFIASMVFLLIGLFFFLPGVPITESSIQAYPAQAAYLKDAGSFLVLALFFLLLPSHFIFALRGALALEGQEHSRGLVGEQLITIVARRTLYPRFWVLCLLLVLFALIAVAGTAHLLDHLKPGPYMNLFVQLLYLRGILYFAGGLYCLLWYQRVINRIKNGCLSPEAQVAPS